MPELPSFNEHGLLPAGDYTLTLPELRESSLVTGDGVGSTMWDVRWRRHLVNNLEIMVRQLWEVGITEIFVDGSFVEQKDSPHDIDGYFECDSTELRRLVRGAERHRSSQGVDLGCQQPPTPSQLDQEATADVAPVSSRAVSPLSGPAAPVRHPG
jgi:hypothetical protein